MNAYNDKMVCFGGFGDGDRLNTVHFWSKGMLSDSSLFVLDSVLPPSLTLLPEF